MDANNPESIVVDPDDDYVEDIIEGVHVYHPRRYKKNVGEYDTILNVEVDLDEVISYKICSSNAGQGDLPIMNQADAYRTKQSTIPLTIKSDS